MRGLTLFKTRNRTPYSSDGFRAIWQRAMRACVDAGNTRFKERDLRAKTGQENLEDAFVALSGMEAEASPS